MTSSGPTRRCPSRRAGIPAVQEFMRTSFRAVPDLHFSEPDPPHLSVEGDRVAWAWSMEGTMRGHIDPPGFAPTGRALQGRRRGPLDDARAAGSPTTAPSTTSTTWSASWGSCRRAGSRAERVTAALQRLQVRLTGR